MVMVVLTMVVIAMVVMVVLVVIMVVSREGDGIRPSASTRMEQV